MTLVTFTLPGQAYEDECKPPKTSYESVYCTSDDSYFVANDSDYKIQALINRQGKMVANLKGYDAIDHWGIEDGVFAVMKNGKVGYMNTQGKLVIPSIYDSMQDPDDKYDET